MGIEVAHRYVERAPLLLLCVEAGRKLTREEHDFREGAEARDQRVIVVRTKADLGMAAREADSGVLGLGDGAGAVETPQVFVSTVTGAGLERLRSAMLHAVFAGLAESAEQPLVTRGRQVRALRRAAAEVEEFGQTFGRGLAPEVAATHLQDATVALEELLGVVEVEEILGVLFSDFCVGK